MGYRISIASKNRRRALEPVWPHHLVRASSFHPPLPLRPSLFRPPSTFSFVEAICQMLSIPKCEKRHYSYYNFEIKKVSWRCSLPVHFFLFYIQITDFVSYIDFPVVKELRLFMAALLISVLHFPALIAQRYAVTCPSAFFPRVPSSFDPVESLGRGIIHYPWYSKRARASLNWSQLTGLRYMGRINKNM